MNCTSCSSPLQPNEEFCGNCGRPVAVTASQDPTAPAYQPERWNSEPSLSPPPGTLPSVGTPFPPPPLSPYQQPSYQTPPIQSAPPPNPYQAPPSYQQSYLQPVNRPLPTSGKAIAALIVGVAGIVTGLDLLVFPGIVAVVLGHIARREINQRPGQLGGNGLALAGLITGYIGTAFSLIYWAFIIISLIIAISAGAH